MVSKTGMNQTPNLAFDGPLESNSGNISYLYRAGEPTFVFVHGLGGHKEHFRTAFDAHSGLGKGVLSLDLMGFGASGRLRDDEEYLLKNQAGALSTLLADLDIPSINLVVHSMSSGIIPDMLALGTVDVSAIYLLEGNLVEADSDWSGTLSAMSDDEYEDYIKRIKKTARLVLSRQLARPHLRNQVQEWSNCFQMADERALRETARHVHQATIGGEIAEALAEYSGPVVYIRGDADQDWPGRDTLASIGAEFVVIENAGHYMMLDAPNEVYQVIFGMKA